MPSGPFFQSSTNFNSEATRVLASGDTLTGTGGNNWRLFLVGTQRVEITGTRPIEPPKSLRATHRAEGSAAAVGGLTQIDPVLSPPPGFPGLLLQVTTTFKIHARALLAIVLGGINVDVRGVPGVITGPGGVGGAFDPSKPLDFSYDATLRQPDGGPEQRSSRLVVTQDGRNVAEFIDIGIFEMLPVSVRDLDVAEGTGEASVTIDLLEQNVLKLGG